MSGGSYEYIHSKVNYAISLMEENQNEHPELFREKAIKISEAYAEFIRTIEWVDSGDCGPEDALEALNKFKKEIEGI
jgi:hypothetical protein